MYIYEETNFQIESLKAETSEREQRMAVIHEAPHSEAPPLNF